MDESGAIEDQEESDVRGRFPSFQVAEDDAYSSRKDLNVASSDATATTGNGLTNRTGTGTLNLEGTTPLDRAIDSDEDLY